MTYSAKGLSVSEVLALLKRGEEVSCSKCGSRLQTIPEEWAEGTPLRLIKCPISEGHYVVFFEDAEAMHDIRDLIRSFGRK
jgi:hypothetical protein